MHLFTHRLHIHGSYILCACVHMCVTHLAKEILKCYQVSLKKILAKKLQTKENADN